MDLTRLTGSISGPAVFLCLLSLFFAGCKKTEQVPHETPTIIYEHPVTMDIPVTGSWVGHLDGVDNASIVPQITGYLQTQNYANGAIVKKGEVLFRIDDSTFRDQVSKAKATLAQAAGPATAVELRRGNLQAPGRGERHFQTEIRGYAPLRPGRGSAGAAGCGGPGPG